ncbi:type II secretion system F family protein [Candidatus Woesearchaeota archaeon]|nr:type II secretion system F family protein [Candidatus Woesearchaeota archaeon]
MTLIYRKIARRVPDLSLKLRQARLYETEDAYVKRIFFTSLYLSFGLLFVGFFFVQSPWVFVAFPLVFPFAFLYFLNYVDFKIQKVVNGINQEIIFAGRFLIIELESGVPMYVTFKNLAKNYDIIGKYFAEIIEKVDLGTTMEDALNEAIVLTPSPNFRKMLWQLLNSMKTGSDVTNALNVVIDQIVREQQIEVKEYGRKLNPLAMFYMMAAIIIPSLGTTMLVVLATFIGFQISLVILFVLTGMIAFVQFMFLSIIKTIRPPMEL